MYFFGHKAVWDPFHFVKKNACIPLKEFPIQFSGLSGMLLIKEPTLPDLVIIISTLLWSVELVIYKSNG
jgi:hypothetical protein